MAETLEKQPLNPTALSIADAAKVLSKTSGQSIDAEMIEEDLSEGAPQNQDGTINLVCYAAWLVREMSKRAN